MVAAVRVHKAGGPEVLTYEDVQVPAPGQGQIKISRHAYDKDLIYKDVSRNHLLGQLTGFRIGKDTRFDDLVDCFTYGIAIALGDQAGF